MGNAAGVKRNFKELERRRLKAGKLLQNGWSQADVARQVGVSRESVRRWADALHEQGAEGLRSSGRIGRPSRLGDEDLVCCVVNMVTCNPFCGSVMHARCSVDYSDR